MEHTLIEELKDLLEKAKAEKAEAMKPYDLRIKDLRRAIDAAQAFETASQEINDRPKESVTKIHND